MSVLSFALLLIRPYWRWLALVLAAMMIEIATSLAAPWPLKVVLDSVFDSRPLPPFLAAFLKGTADRFLILNAAVAATV